MSNKLFVLGPPDPEMEEIERVVRACGHQVAYASLMNKRVRSNEAYFATGVLGQIDLRSELIFVECNVLGLSADYKMDHHSPGDPGYLCGPEQYFEGSSIGQVLNFLEVEPTEEQRIIAAADHCPTQAYLGLCPGIDPEKLRVWRTMTRAKRRKMSFSEMEHAISVGKSILEKAQKIEYCGTEFSWLDSRDNEVQEASARFNIPFMYKELVPESIKFDETKPVVDKSLVKMGIMGAAPETISAWMTESRDVLDRVYGAPLRGYAGGYVEL